VAPTALRQAEQAVRPIQASKENLAIDTSTSPGAGSAYKQEHSTYVG
jgi:hypothetical protein